MMPAPVAVHVIGTRREAEDVAAAWSVLPGVRLERIEPALGLDLPEAPGGPVSAPMDPPPPPPPPPHRPPRSPRAPHGRSLAA